MKPFENYKGGARLRLSSEQVSHCLLTRVFHAWSARNAWHSTYSKQYVIGDSFSLSWEEAYQHVEQNKVQGSRWIIEELPACAFVGPSFSLIVTEINSARPLQKLRGIRPTGTDLLSTGAQFEPALPNTIVRLVAPSQLVHAAVGPFRTYLSRSVRGYREWSDYGHIRSHGVTALRKRFSAHLAESRRATTDDPHLAAGSDDNPLLEVARQMGDSFYQISMPLLVQNREQFEHDIEMQALFFAWQEAEARMDWDRYREFWLEEYAREEAGLSTPN